MYSRFSGMLRVRSTGFRQSLRVDEILAGLMTRGLV
jgi:hypothetical protein